jgi:adenylate kinase
VHQAEALDRMLKEKHLELDAVIELKVDEDSLLHRIEKRVAETMARGEPLRADDNAEALKKRLDAYRQLTAPLIGYYAGKGMLRTIDGMAPIEEVAKSLTAVLEEAAAPKPARRARPVTVARRKPSERMTGRKLPGRRVSAHRRTATGKVGKPAAAAARAGRGKLAKATAAAKKAVKRPARAKMGGPKAKPLGKSRRAKAVGLKGTRPRGRPRTSSKGRRGAANKRGRKR